MRGNTRRNRAFLRCSATGVAVSLVVLALYGCSAAEITGAATIQKVQGGQLYSSPAEGFNVKIPSSWIFLSPNSKDLQAAINTVKDANPALAKSLNDGPLSGQMSNLADAGVKVMAYDTASDVATTNFATNMNVVHMPVPPEFTTLEQVTNENINELNKEVGSMMSGSIFRTLSHVGSDRIPAERLEYTFTANMPNGNSLNASVIQYLVLKEHDEYVFTFTTAASEVGSDSIAFDGIVTSVQLTK